MPSPNWPAAAWKPAGCPQAGGVRPQLLVTVDLDSLLGHSGALGGEAGWAGPLDPEACQRLACDGAVTRVLVSHHPTPDHPCCDHQDLRARLQAAMALLPPVLGGAPSQPLDVGRTTRVVQPASAAPWPYGTAAVSSRVVTGRWPGVRPIICGTGWMAARPTSRTWCCCVGLTIGWFMRVAGGCSVVLMGGSPAYRPIDNTGPRPELARGTSTSTWLAFSNASSRFRGCSMGH
jgi:hypothetical protein